MKLKIILFFALCSAMSNYAQDKKESGFSSSSELYYNKQIGDASKHDIEDRKKEIEDNNVKADSFLKSGNEYVQLKKYDEAIEAFSKAIEINTNFQAAYYNRGLVEVVSGQKEKGCQDLRKAADLGEKDAEKMILKYCN